MTDQSVKRVPRLEDPGERVGVEIAYELDHEETCEARVKPTGVCSSISHIQSLLEMEPHGVSRILHILVPLKTTISSPFGPTVELVPCVAS